MLAKGVSLEDVGPLTSWMVYLFQISCHIKTKFSGQVFTVVGLDPNDYMYPNDCILSRKIYS
jgi:hypothetical protein